MTTRFLLLLLLALPLRAQPFTTGDPVFSQNCSSLLQGLVGYWRLEEASGTRYDMSGKNNNLTSNNSVGQSSGKVGNCASFVAASSQWLGKSSPVSIPSGTSPLTFIAWVNLTNITTTRELGGVWEYGLNKRSWFLQEEQPTNRFAMIISSNGTASSTFYANTFGAVSQQVWYMVCASYDGSTAYLSVNGGTEDSLSYPNGIFNAGTMAFTLGTILNSGVPPASITMNGFIDEAALWNRKLSSREVSNYYNMTLGTHIPFAHP